MRVIVFVKATADSEAGVVPPPETFEAMGRFNEELIKAGVLLAAEGLHPSDQGARVTSENGRLIVKDGPFAEAKELRDYFLRHSLTMPEVTGVLPGAAAKRSLTSTVERGAGKVSRSSCGGISDRMCSRRW